MRNLILTLLLTASLYASAQKLPYKQEGSLWAPANIKIDGKLSEWKNGFSAYNSSTELYYTLSNDDENLYLVVQTTQPRVIQKIMLVGLDLIINTKNKKDTAAKTATTISFPQINVADGSRVMAKAGIKTLAYTMQSSNAVLVADADSSVAQANRLFANAAKEIKIKGAKIGFADTLISAYNEQRVRAVAAIDNQKHYNYELAIPLKVLGLSANATKGFSYCLQLQSRLVNIKKGGMIVSYKYKDGVAIDADQDLNSTTNFWSEYMLAKKP